MVLLMTGQQVPVMTTMQKVILAATAWQNRVTGYQLLVISFKFRFFEMIITVSAARMLRMCFVDYQKHLPIKFCYTKTKRL